MASSNTQSYSMSRTTKQRSISLDPAILKKGLLRAKQRGFGKSFSAYVNRRIEEDNEELNGTAKPAAKPAANANGKDNGR